MMLLLYVINAMQLIFLRDLFGLVPNAEIDSKMEKKKKT